MIEKKRALAIVSGGLDSVVLAHLLASQGYDLHILSFDYGQKHKKELEFARECAARLGADFHIVDLSGYTPLIAGSALTSGEIDVPHGHYAAENMAITVVPNRNAIMLALAYGAAVNENANLVATAVHGGDHCLPVSTLVSTREGPKPMGNLVAGVDEVLSFNEDRREVEWKPVLQVIKKARRSAFWSSSLALAHVFAAPKNIKSLSCAAPIGRAKKVGKKN